MMQPMLSEGPEPYTRTPPDGLRSEMVASSDYMSEAHRLWDLIRHGALVACSQVR